MKLTVSMTAALLLAVVPVQPATAQSGIDLVKQAVAAQGGADALRAIKTLVIKGEAKHWEPGQSPRPAASRASSATRPSPYKRTSPTG